MKKFMTSIKTLAALLMAGAAFTACSSSDDITNETQQPANPTGKYTMTIQASKGDGAMTRALSLSGSTLNATWAAGEEVLVYQNGSPIGTLTAAENDDVETTLSGTLESAPAPDQDLTFYFHTAANPDYDGQDGTLTKIASTYDFCAPATVTSGNFTVDSENKTVSASGITFGANKQAIVQFTFKDKANDATISPSALTTSVDISSSADATTKTTIQIAAAAAGIELPYNSEITIPDETYDENEAGVIYLAIPDKLANLQDSKQYFDFTITATVGDDTYTLTKSGFPFSNGNYYEITAKMTKQAPAVTGHALSSAVVGEIVGSDGLAYAGTNYDKLPTGVTAVAKVCYVDGSGNGLALAMANEGSMSFSSATSACATHTPTITGGTWKLASKDEWTNMVNSAGSANNLRYGFSSVGGTNLEVGDWDGYYWSSTDGDANCACCIDFNDNGRWWSNTNKSWSAFTRACLAF